MSIQKVRDYFSQWGMEDRVMELSQSSATVEEAAAALHTEGRRIAKSMSFLAGGHPILVLFAGDARVDNHKFKERFHKKATMIKAGDVERLIGHPVGGVCPFAVNDDVEVFLDESLKRFQTVFPACGTANSAMPGNGSTYRKAGKKQTNKKGVSTMQFTFKHTNFNVLDLQRSMDFYKEALGLTEVSRIENPDFTIVYLGDGVSDFQLELTWLKDRKEPYNLGENEFHTAFAVKDMKAALAKHKDMGCVVYQNPAMGIYFIVDPDGYWLEIIPER